jgi:hypothetical protein
VADQTYQFVVAGEISPWNVCGLRGLTLTRGDGVTTLTAGLRDEAELSGLLGWLLDLGLTLLSVGAVGGPFARVASDAGR